MTKKRSFLTSVIVYLTAFVAVFCFSYSQVHAFDCEYLISVDINSASEEELVCITHIGSSRAKDLISLRPFSSVEDMQRIGGIGKPGSVTLTAIKEQGLAAVDGGVIVDEEKKEEKETEEEEDEKEETETSETQTEASAHSSPVKLSTFDEIETFKISAGRDRLTSVESEIRFMVYVESDANIPRNAKFEWVMGDGSVKKGREVKHRYFASGKYTVVLTVRLGKEEAVSRVNVEVVEPEISINSVDKGVITLLNSAEKEVNLGGWEIVSGKKSFVIPDNTIIGPTEVLPLHKQVTKIDVNNDEEVRMSSPGGGFENVYRTEEDGTKEEGGVTKVESSTGEKERLRSEIRFLREEVNRLTASEQRVVDTAVGTPESVDIPEEKENEEPEEESVEKEKSSSEQTKVDESDVRVIYEKEEEKSGIWRRLLGAPSAVFNKLPF